MSLKDWSGAITGRSIRKLKRAGIWLNRAKLSPIYETLTKCQ